jgi:putative transposase
LSSLDSCYEGAALTVGAKEEVLAFTAFPTEHWRQIWSTNPLSVNRLPEGGLAEAA